MPRHESNMRTRLRKPLTVVRLSIPSRVVPVGAPRSTRAGAALLVLEKASVEAEAAVFVPFDPGARSELASKFLSNLKQPVCAYTEVGR